MSDAYLSWGRYPRIEQRASRPAWRDELRWPEKGDALPRGNGRSYGDSCLVDRGTLLDLRLLDRFLEFDRESGRLRCEAGVLLADIHDLVLASGWSLAVSPGTRFVTVGGAIANDVHGKNHHRRGSFGNHVLRFELLRSNGQRLLCSAAENAELFRATIGGLGLTGVISWAELQLQQADSSWLEVETLRFRSLGEFFELSRESDESHEYTVGWIDCAAGGERLGRGLYMRAGYSRPGDFSPEPSRRRRGVPVTPPFALVNRLVLRGFNELYFRWPRPPRRVQHVLQFLYPLDAIDHWNRLYGPAGFLQHQCVVPPEAGQAAIRTLLERISASKMGSFLAVLKVFGPIPSRGMLSFARPGVTLALDFPIAGRRTFDLLSDLDDIVLAAGGAVYPAKDARMSATVFKRLFPAWERIEQLRDPRICSAFWRRVTAPG
jgi:FAD/FMN-containing dehydrogenase